MRIEKKIIAAVYIPAHVKTTKYYEFTELNKEIQERLIKEKQDEVTNDEYFWQDIYCDEFKESALNTIREKIPGIEDEELQFSLNCCQGDGVSFTGELGEENIASLLSLVYGGNIPRQIKRIIPHMESIVFERNRHLRYCHEYTVSTEIKINGHEYYTEFYPRIEKLLEDLEKQIDQYRVEICKKLEKEGYDLQDYYTGREYAIQELSSNEYYESGEVA